MKVLNQHNVGRPKNAEYIGRGSPWGNPFKMNSRRDRFHAVKSFENYARKRLIVEPDWLQPLHGKDLVCFCAPLPCHGDVLVKLCEEVYGRD